MSICFPSGGGTFFLLWERLESVTVDEEEAMKRERLTSKAVITTQLRSSEGKRDQNL